MGCPGLWRGAPGLEAASETANHSVFGRNLFLEPPLMCNTFFSCCAWNRDVDSLTRSVQTHGEVIPQKLLNETTGPRRVCRALQKRLCWCCTGDIFTSRSGALKCLRELTAHGENDELELGCVSKVQCGFLRPVPPYFLMLTCLLNTETLSDSRLWSVFQRIKVIV